MEWKIFIESSYNHNIHTEKKFFVVATFEGWGLASFHTE